MTGFKLQYEPLTLPELSNDHETLICAALPELEPRIKCFRLFELLKRFTVSEISWIRTFAYILENDTQDPVRKAFYGDLFVAVDGQLEVRSAMVAADEKPTVFRFKITPQGTDGRIWREFELTNGTLEDLQVASGYLFGWTGDWHDLYIGGEQFTAAESMCGIPYSALRTRMTEPSMVRLSEIFLPQNAPMKFEYVYDPTPRWYHDLVFLGCSEVQPDVRYPRCVDGAGTWPECCIESFDDFPEFLAALEDDSHENHSDVQEFIGNHQLDSFDLAEADRSFEGLRNGT